jgi:acetyl esterase/lipase
VTNEPNVSNEPNEPNGPALTPLLAERLPVLDGVPPMGLGPPDPDATSAFMRFTAPVDGYAVPALGVVDVDDVTVPGPHGDIPVRVYRPAHGEATHGLVWAHGGAFVFGDLDMPESDVVARELAARHSTVVVAVDYRLCVGGVHFPVPHDDLHAAFRWAARDSGLLPTAGRWSVGGASAGGNLAAGVGLRLRRDSTGQPTAVVLAYPVVHHPIPAPSPELRKRLDSLPPALIFPPSVHEHLGRNFLGAHHADTEFAFVGRGDVAGFPPTFITVGDHDDLGPSGLTFAEQLRQSGVAVAVELVTGVPHGHLNMAGLPEALRSIDAIAAFLHSVPAGGTERSGYRP